ncbi:MAG: helix-turn-helix domain-containing protein [Betaproteobacteria bacterium]|nr:helix-turn-helix domain-containing protein [Betaproteobacteria bacterium]
MFSAAGRSILRISARLGRAPSTVSREARRQGRRRAWQARRD